MKRKLKPFYSFAAILLASFLLDACHSSKEVTASTGYSGRRSENPPRSSSSEKSSGSNESARKENVIINTYSAKLGVSKNHITNYQLYKFIDEWYGTPYKFAGRSHSGVDCSDFASLLFQHVYNISVSGPVTNLYKHCKPIKPSQLKEGDLIFFKINTKSLSHVGVYLQNHRFVHASVHSGVVIDDLNESYYKKYFYAAGRVLH